MPLRPFPYPLRVGTDICNVARLRRIVAKEHDGQPYLLHKFLRQVFTPPERTYFWDRFGPLPEIPKKLDAVSEYLAGRFAAKEAIRKACDHFEASARGFQSIIILPVASRHRDSHYGSAPPRGLVLDTPYVQPREARQDPPTADRNSKDAVNQSLEDGGVIKKYLGGPYLARGHTRVDDLNGQLCEISISHDGDLATAVALVPSMERQVPDTRMSREKSIKLSPKHGPA